jgi:short-subunit dehydrogenase
MSTRELSLGSLKQRVRQVLVVGASSGVGKLVADGLAKQNVVVSTVGRTRPTPTYGWHHQCPDLTELDWTHVYDEAQANARVPIDAVVYVAGTAAFGRTSQIPPARARELFEANFWTPAAAAVAAEQLWAAPSRGTFVSVSSISARRAVPFEAHYCASKAACARFLDALHLEHPDGRVRFLSVYPGRLQTQFRGKADWYGLPPDPAASEGNDPATVARAVLRLLAGRRGPRVLGIRERAIDLADRVSPLLYDKLVLKRRVAAVLRKGVP